MMLKVKNYNLNVTEIPVSDSKNAFFRNFQFHRRNPKQRCHQLTADTLSFVSVTLTDTCDITGTTDDTVLTCCLTIMNTAHFWISKSFPVQKPFWVCTYAQARGDPEFPETFSIALDHAKEAKKGLNLFKTISSLFLRVCYLKSMKDFEPNHWLWLFTHH